MFDSFMYKHIQEWYLHHGRHQLPWRHTDDAYAIYVSEVMLQQTQVDTVLDGYYFPFLDQFPTLSALAQADEEAVLSAWQGLGYYRRAKHLHRTAQLAAPSLPRSIQALMDLPGIGKNTAHAIACFAYGEAVPILEANVKRIVARLYRIEHPSESLWEIAAKLVDRDDPFTYNQALMDIGSTVCTPRHPSCERCPLQTSCLGKTNPEAYPKKHVKKAIPIRKKHIYILLDYDQKIAMRQRETAFLGGLYGFYETEQSTSHPFSNPMRLGSIKQIYSHFTMMADIFLIRHSRQWEDFIYFPFGQAKELPMSRADEKVMDLLSEHVFAKKQALLE